MNLLQKTLLAVSAALYLGSRLLCSQTTNSTLVCSGAENCNRCVQDPSCFWCETQLLCKVYGVKNEKNETKNCDDWNWKTCEKTDTPLLAIISGCTSLVLISGKFFFLLFFFFFYEAAVTSPTNETFNFYLILQSFPTHHSLYSPEIPFSVFFNSLRIRWSFPTHPSLYGSATLLSFPSLPSHASLLWLAPITTKPTANNRGPNRD